MASAVITVVGYAMAAYSAVSAIKALKEGDIMGAVMGAVGAYTGFNIGSAAMNAGTAASVGTAATATTSANSVLGGMGGTAAQGAGGLMSAAPATGLGAMGGAGVSGAMSAAPLSAAVAPAVQSTGLLQGMASKAVDFGNAVGDIVVDASGNLVDSAGNMWDAVTKQPIGAGVMTGSNVMQGLQFAGGLYAKSQEQKAQKEIYDEAAARDRFLADRDYKNRNTVPTYIHDFRTPKQLAAAGVTK